MSWKLSVATCRCTGSSLQTTSYVLEGGPDMVAAVSHASTEGLEDIVRQAQSTIGLDEATVEAGVVNGTPYLLVLSRGAVVELGPGPSSIAEHPRTRSDCLGQIILGPSAALSIAEEWRLSSSPIESANLLLTCSGVSPYPPHRSPLGNTSLQALAADPFRWSRPFAALDADCATTLSLSSSATDELPARACFIESLVPLVTNSDTMEWNAAVCGAPDLHIRVPLRTLIRSVTGAVSQPSVALIDDPIAGERYGFAPALATTLFLRDVELV